MIRAILVVIGCVLLAGCWVSERFFHDGDWARLDLDGRYTSEDANGDEQARVTLQTRRSGLIDSTSVGIEDGKKEHGILGLVPITGGSGRYFLMVDRTDETGDGDFYMIARIAERVQSPAGDDRDAIELFWPDCEGTPAADGLKIEEESFAGFVCTFSSEAALMKAALEAERFLSAPHIVTIQPMGKLVPDDDSAEAE